jgi:dTDP-4-amino-4,6-dideoxygalactose transaminase
MPDPRVPFVALDRQHAPLRAELQEAFDRVVGASSFVLGQEVEGFEQDFAAYCGVRHCVGVASGTAALTLALQALGVGQGDEVIVPAHTFVASALAVVHAGATPVFCDVEPETGLIDAASARSVITGRTAAVIAVHLYGQVCDMDALTTLAQAHGLKLVEDAAQAHGATWRGRPAGALGDAAAFSFYPSKNLGALGDGGAVCTDDDRTAEEVRALRHIGQRTKGLHELVGWNERLDGLQAALLRVKLPHLDGWNERRRHHAGALRDGLPESMRALHVEEGGECVYHLFPVRHEHRDALRTFLDSRGIDTGIHYHPSVDRQPIFLGKEGAPTPHSQIWAQQELSLPMFEHLEPGEIDRVLVAVRDFCAET